MTDEQKRELLWQLEKRLRENKVMPGIVPNEAMRALVNGKAILLVVEMHGHWDLVRIWLKPHPAERFFELNHE